MKIDSICSDRLRIECVHPSMTHRFLDIVEIKSVSLKYRIINFVDMNILCNPIKVSV